MRARYKHLVLTTFFIGLTAHGMENASEYEKIERLANQVVAFKSEPCVEGAFIGSEQRQYAYIVLSQMKKKQHPNVGSPSNRELEHYWCYPLINIDSDSVGRFAIFRSTCDQYELQNITSQEKKMLLQALKQKQIKFETAETIEQAQDMILSLIE